MSYATWHFHSRPFCTLAVITQLPNAYRKMCQWIEYNWLGPTFGNKSQVCVCMCDIAMRPFDSDRVGADRMRDAERRVTLLLPRWNRYGALLNGSGLPQCYFGLCRGVCSVDSSPSITSYAQVRHFKLRKRARIFSSRVNGPAFFPPAVELLA